MFNISSSFSPIRVVAGQKDPVILNIKIKNQYLGSKLASVLIKAPFSLGFDKVGLYRETRRRVGHIKEGSEKVIPIQVFPKTNIQEGTYNVDVKVYAHPDRYDKVEKEYIHSTSLRVISK